MAGQLHQHGDAPPHEHEGATPGHTHDAGFGPTSPAGETAPPPGTAPPAGTAPPPGTAPAGTAPAAAGAAHDHPGLGTHTHADDAAGHSHGADYADYDRRPAAVDVRPTAGGIVTRVVLTLLGAAGMIIGAFLVWAFNTPGTNVEYQAFYAAEQVRGESAFFTSAGFIVIILGLLALLGLVPRTGWLTTLAGVLGIVAFALVLITIYRVNGTVADVELGLWVVLAGGIVALIGGFFGARPRAVARTPDTTARY